ncbi:MAG: TolB family protein [Planctomycetota bacterium]
MPITISPHYRDLRQHTKRMRAGQILHACVSPDGQRFTFASAEQGGLPQVYLQESDAVVAAQITNTASTNLYPRISPDGRYIAFASNRYWTFDIFVAPMDAPSTVM